MRIGITRCFARSLSLAIPRSHMQSPPPPSAHHPMLYRREDEITIGSLEGLVRISNDSKASKFDLASRYLCTRIGCGCLAGTKCIKSSKNKTGSKARGYDKSSKFSLDSYAVLQFRQVRIVILSFGDIPLSQEVQRKIIACVLVEKGHCTSLICFCPPNHIVCS
ncbi:hypothetical protein PoB_005042400 [Plakobranchus ocellatus]|uniref:Uncharacterized protein n=1 Tax=Plakobranchus ocellatus TaxID=259542 RepID=A0AAV4BYL3_9GAST|nr:hypothetical protein PoB_005042400 [Plakobranchus ocellatus]